MLSQISTIKSSFPGAFAALGVGALISSGNILLLRKWPPSHFGISSLGQVSKDSLLATVIPYILAGSAFFVMYGIGFALIGIAGRLRSLSRVDDTQQLATLFALGNDNLIKYYFEQRAVVDVLDGLGLATFIFFSCSGAAFFLPDNPLYFTAVVFFALSSTVAIWRESHKRTAQLKSLLSTYSNKGCLVP